MSAKYIKLFENFNNKFYLMVDDVSKLDGFKNGILKGLKGISENPDINNVLGTPFDIFIEMDKDKVLEENDLIKIEYNNIEFLSENGFKMFKRIKGGGIQIMEGYNFFIFISEILEMNDYYNFNLEESNKKLYDFLLSPKYKSELKKQAMDIKNIIDFTDFISLFLDMDKSVIKDDLSSALIDIVQPYRYEEEWYVKGDYFKIPYGSTIEVYLDNIIDNIGEENIEECKMFFDSLVDYNIKYL